MPRYTYTPNEYADMHFIYGECNAVALAASELYQERYPNRHPPDYRVFINVHNAYSEGRIPGGGIGGRREGRPARLDVDEEVLAEVEAEPSTSVRKIARRTGIPKSTVYNVLKRHELHPYHVQRVQRLLPADYPQRIQFCRRMLRKMNQDPEFFNKILWSDESSCRNDGYMNMHNLHSWQLENPHAMREERSQTQFQINLWTETINREVIGPHELPSTLSGEAYLDFLQNYLPFFLEDMPLATRQNMWLQNDGCPAHYARVVRGHLNRRYPQRWIGRLGPIAWPPRSPDLNPVDFFYWGCLRDHVYQTEVTSVAELRAKTVNRCTNYGRWLCTPIKKVIYKTM